MKSRATQLIARWVAKVMILAFGVIFGRDAMTPDTTNAVTTIGLEIATATVALIGIGIDMLIHRAETGGFMKAAGTRG